MIRVKLANIIDTKFQKLQKLIAVFILSIILFNSLVPKNVELKQSFMSAINCAVNTIQTNFYEKYSAVVMTTIKCVLNSIKIIKNTELVKCNNQKAGEKSSAPVSTSEEGGAIIHGNTNNQIKTIKANTGCLFYETSKKEYGLYESVAVSSSKETAIPGILFFILFSIMVVRKKDTINSIINKKYIKVNRLGY